MRLVAFLDRHLVRLVTAGLVGVCCWLVVAAVVVAGCSSGSSLDDTPPDPNTVSACAEVDDPPEGCE